MIRLTFLLRRKPGTGFEEFQRYWREVHGPLVASHAQRLNILRYVQFHSLADPDHEQPAGPRGQMARPFDGVAELWWENREAVAENSNAGAAEAAAELLEDEMRFIDLPHSPGWFAYECPQINPTPETLVASPLSPIVKLYYPLHHPADMPFEDVQLYWRMNHGPLVRRYGPAIGALKYIQVHRLDDDLNEVFAEARKTEDPPFFGHAELWFDASRSRQGAEADRGRQALYEDERKFIDFSRSASWMGKEWVFVDLRG